VPCLLHRLSPALICSLLKLNFCLTRNVCSRVDVQSLACGSSDTFFMHNHATVAATYLLHNTHNRFTALLEYVWDHPGEQAPERC